MYDFRLPAWEEPKKDTSAAAVAACGLLQLAALIEEHPFRKPAGGWRSEPSMRCHGRPILRTREPGAFCVTSRWGRGHLNLGRLFLHGALDAVSAYRRFSSVLVMKFRAV